MKPCRKCRRSFFPTPYQVRKCDYLCPACRKNYDAAWREGRRAAGLPSSGSKTWDPAKRATWRAAYYTRDDVKARRVEQMRQSVGRHPDRAAARRRVRHEIEVGRLVRQPCEVCGEARAHAHHDDYTKPLVVRWLCRKHHDEHHAKAEGK